MGVGTNFDCAGANICRYQSKLSTFHFVANSLAMRYPSVFTTIACFRIFRHFQRSHRRKPAHSFAYFYWPECRVDDGNDSGNALSRRRRGGKTAKQEDRREKREKGAWERWEKRSVDSFDLAAIISAEVLELRASRSDPLMINSTPRIQNRGVRHDCFAVINSFFFCLCRVQNVLRMYMYAYVSICRLCKRETWSCVSLSLAPL